MRISPGLLIALLLPLVAFAEEPRKTELVLFVSADGVRWQDVFRGADESLMNKEAGGIRGTPNALRKQWWRQDPLARRKLLMPFLWERIAKDGQIWGNRDAGSQCEVLNDQNFSYPGYSEFLCGFVDPRITSNDPIPNENVSVLEWLNGRGPTKGRVGAVNCWTVLSAILNAERSKIPMWTQGFPTPEAWVSPVTRQIDELARLTPVPWSDATWDSFVYTVARDVLTRTKPKVLYVNFGEPDEWAHAVRYDRYLDAVHNVDSFLAGLWEAAQSIPEYSGKTTLIVTTDHGRGIEAKTWTSHGAKIPESKETWFAAVGPDVPALGERTNVPPQKTAGAAATIAEVLGENWNAAEPKAAAPWPVLQQ